jgi:hypothetical protein
MLKNLIDLKSDTSFLFVSINCTMFSNFTLSVFCFIIEWWWLHLVYCLQTFASFYRCCQNAKKAACHLHEKCFWSRNSVKIYSSDILFRKTTMKYANSPYICCIKTSNKSSHIQNCCKIMVLTIEFYYFVTIYLGHKS